MRRVALAAVVAGLTVLSTAPPAAAHTVTGVRPTNYASRLLGLHPSVTDIDVRLLDLGRRIELRNRGPEVVVLGYSNEPYLRIGPSGVFENRRSATTYQNRVTGPASTTTVPPSVAAGGPPSWRRVRSEPVARWRDRRTRYEGPQPAGGKKVLSTWTVEVQRGPQRIAISGLITYVPGPSPLPWAIAVVALVAATVASAWSKSWGRWLSVALALLLASDVIHSFGTAAATHEAFAAQLARVLIAGLVTTAAWIVGGVAIPGLQRNHEGGLVAGAGVGLVIAVFSGVTDLGVFANSQVATVFPAVTARIAVALALGLGIGLVGAAIAVIARDPALRPTVAPAASGTPARPRR
jgi:hypothetical protein